MTPESGRPGGPGRTTPGASSAAAVEAADGVLRDEIGDDEVHAHVRRAALAALALAVVVLVVGAPLMGWPRVVRLPAVLVPALALAAWVAWPLGRRDGGVFTAGWQPSRRLVWSAAVVVGALLFWYVLTRFRSGEINAVDFTIYYDRPCFQTVHGRPLFVEVSDTPGLSHRSELADHAYWGMLLVCSPYALYPSPLWLHALAAASIVGGAVHVLRVFQRLGAGGVLAGATALAFVLNDNTARTLNYGFHPEVLYAWFIPWMIHAGLRGARTSFLLATLAAVLVKEDACLPLFAVSVALALNGVRKVAPAGRGLFLLFPTFLAITNLAVYYGWVVPLLTGDSRPTYAHFWSNYGETPMLALVGMARHPGRVLESTLRSGIFRTIQPHLFLPLIGWRWALGAVPIVTLYGASANEQVRAFGIYYAIVLVPFLVIAASTGAMKVARRFVSDVGQAERVAGVAVLLGALLVGSGHRGYSLRPWKAETAAVPEAVAALAGEPTVLVQSGLLPHAGYDERFQLLTAETLNDRRNLGAVLLLTRHAGAYPFTPFDVDRLSQLAPAGTMPGGLVAVRLSQPPMLRPHRFPPWRGRRFKPSPPSSRGGLDEGCSAAVRPCHPGPAGAPFTRPR
ncbi:MAG: hypothetical protein DMF78_23275 [Acidobacteria bacterium]|nr:MAG: hypothetical protein DMF78_23275 [Acidobacteriota bacterium]